MMKRNCRKISMLFSRWERGAGIGDEEKGLFLDHLKGCHACGLKYGSMLPFIAGKDEILNEVFPFPTGRASTITDGLMEKIRVEAAREDTLAETKNRERPGAVIRFPDRFAIGTVVRKRIFYGAAAVAMMLGSFFFGFHAAGGAGKGDPNTLLVHFTLSAPGANSVSLVGDFNDWDQGQYVLTDSDRDGVWTIEIKLSKGNTYTYNFVVDGERWIADPASRRQIDDGFGGKSTLLQL